MPTCMSEWTYQVGCTQGQERSVICRATYCVHAWVDGWLVGPLSASPSVTMPEGKLAPNSSASCWQVSRASSGRVKPPSFEFHYLRVLISSAVSLNVGFVHMAGGEGPCCSVCAQG